MRRGSFNSNDNPAALLLTPDAKHSHFFNSMPRSVVANLQKSRIAMENHQQGAPACRAWPLPALHGVRRACVVARLNARLISEESYQQGMRNCVMWPCARPARYQAMGLADAV